MADERNLVDEEDAVKENSTPAGFSGGVEFVPEESIAGGVILEEASAFVEVVVVVVEVFAVCEVVVVVVEASAAFEVEAE